jgi:spore coat protein SA
MKVAFVTQPGHAVLPAAGSVEIWTAEVARRLAGEHEVTIFASRSARTVDAEEDGIAYRFVADSRGAQFRRAVRRAWRVLPGDRPFFASVLHPLAYWVGVGHALRRGGFDVAHVANYSQALPVLRRLAPRTKLVLHMHCEWLMQLDERMIARRLRHADMVLGCSSALTHGARRRFPTLEGRCHTVPNGTDLEALAFSREDRAAPRRILYVGRISPEKALHVLMDAFMALHAERPDLELVLVGEEAAPPPEMLIRLASDERVRELESYYAGNYAEALRARLSPEATQRVRFTGAVPYGDIAGHYRDADVFVLPSMMEAFGMPLAEALAAGLPAVAARTGGIVDIVEDGVTGLLVEPGDAGALTAALRRMLDDPALRVSLASAGRAKARARFGWDHIAAATRGHLAALGEQSPAPPAGAQLAAAAAAEPSR